jgi:hypothetical protein
MAEVLDLGPGGLVRQRLVMAGQPRLILDRLTPAGDEAAEDRRPGDDARPS